MANFPDLLDSIADQAPRLHVNDSVLVSPDVWWTIVSDEKEPGGREIVAGNPAIADGALWYGGALSVWGVAANCLLLLALLSGFFKNRINPVDRPHRWLVVNHVVVQLATAALIVPVTVAVDRMEDGWQWGSQLCRAWLLGRLILAAATFWSLFAMVFDRFLAVAAPYSYTRWAVEGGSSCRLGVAVAVLGTWMAAALAMFPTGIAMKRDDFVLEEVCAANLSPLNVVFVTMSSFGVPACLVLVVSLALLIARSRSQLVHCSTDADGYKFQPDYRRFTSTDFHDYDVIEETGSAQQKQRHVTAPCGVSCIEAWLCVLLWGPFYCAGLTAAVCGTQLCVDPGVWSLLSWLGFTTVGVAPLVWLVADKSVRCRLRQLLVPSCCQDSRAEQDTTCGGSVAGSYTVSTTLSNDGSNRRFDTGSTL